MKRQTTYELVRFSEGNISITFEVTKETFSPPQLRVQVDGTDDSWWTVMEALTSVMAEATIYVKEQSQ